FSWKEDTRRRSSSSTAAGRVPARTTTTPVCRGTCWARPAAPRLPRSRDAQPRFRAGARHAVLCEEAPGGRRRGARAGRRSARRRRVPRAAPARVSGRQRLAELIRQRQPCVVLTGAGVSTESGIPDFRSPQGLWAEFDPFEYGSIAAFRSDPAKVWRFYAPRFAVLTEAEPNAAHRALARLEH